jgi:imidazolonepropionase-like amidohydrolase
MKEVKMGTLILKNATILNGTGSAPLPNGSVVVEGERIKEILPGPPGRISTGATVIDCRYQTLLPGLIDAHIHVGAVEANIMEQQRRHYTSMLVIRSLKVIKETLDQGFTTARDAGGADPGFREAVRLGYIQGPRLFVAGYPLSQTGGHGDSRLPTETCSPLEDLAGIATRICDGVDQVRRVAREQLRSGVDHLKVMAGGGAMSPSDEIDTSQYSIEELKAAVDEARAVGSYVMAHVYSSRSILNCTAAGIRTLEHGNLLDEEAARAIKETGAFLVPTLVTYEVTPRLGKDLGIPENNIRKMIEARDRGMEALTIAHRVGVKIASGSDLLGPMQTYKGMELELKSRVLGPMGAIVASTKTNAELLRKEKDLGTIETGKLADFILLDGDPLKDMTLFQQYQEKITLIIQGGRIYKNIL